MEHDPLRCRAKQAKNCEHGRVLTTAEVEAQGGWREDGTYFKPDDSIVCMPCYIRLGCPLNPVLTNLSAGRRELPGVTLGAMAGQVLGATTPPVPGALRLKLVHEDGTVTEVLRRTWQDIAPALGAEHFDVVVLIPNELACYVDDVGLLTRRPPNMAASILYAEHRGGTTPLCGPALFFTPRADGDDDELSDVGQHHLNAAILAAKLATASMRANQN